MIRAFLDTNVLVSGAIRPDGKPDQVIRRAGLEFKWLTSDYIVAEVMDVLSRQRIQRKYQLQVGNEYRAGYKARIRELAESVKSSRAISATSRDFKDDPVLAHAADGRADYLVTGDRDLLTLGEFEGIQIVTPEQFLRVLDERKQK